MTDWHIEIDLLQQIDRPGRDWVYFCARYWRTEQDRINGDPPVVVNDFKSGDLLRWVGTPIIEKRIRYLADGTGQFFCRGFAGEYEMPGNLPADTHAAHWVNGSDKLVNRDIGGGRFSEVRIHWPNKFTVGTYSANDLPGWIYEQAEDWIAMHPNATGDHCDPDLAVDRPSQNAKLPVQIRNMPKQVNRTVQDGVRKRQLRQGPRIFSDERPSP